MANLSPRQITDYSIQRCVEIQKLK